MESLLKSKYLIVLASKPVTQTLVIISFCTLLQLKTQYILVAKV